MDGYEFGHAVRYLTDGRRMEENYVEGDAEGHFVIYYADGSRYEGFKVYSV